MESGAKGAEVIVSGKARVQRAKSMKFKSGFLITTGRPAQVSARLFAAGREDMFVDYCVLEIACCDVARNRSGIEEKGIGVKVGGCEIRGGGCK